MIRQSALQGKEYVVKKGRWAVAEDILRCRSVPWCLRKGCAYLPHFRALTQGSNKHNLLRHRASAGRFWHD